MAKQKRKLQNTKKTFTVKVPAANRNYKDTVFRMLFSNRKNLLSLYNAVNQRDYKNPEEGYLDCRLTGARKDINQYQ